eukprot:Skav218353  [mRNA]  locus=scaffold2066:23298:23963:+ [translate_table: standard]
MLDELPTYGSHGIQLGSVLSCLREVHGRPRALDVLEGFRKSLWSEKVEDDPSLSFEVHNVHNFQILAKAPGVLAFEKPAGIETLEALQLLSSELHRPVTSTSRLDQATSGVIPVALGDENSAAANWLQTQWAARLVSKQYICLCKGLFEDKRGDLQMSLRQSAENSMLQEVSPDGRPSRTPGSTVSRQVVNSSFAIFTWSEDSEAFTSLNMKLPNHRMLWC